MVFGPTPRSYKVKLNKKVKNLAFRSALSSFVQNEKLFVLDKLVIENGKTKEFQTVLDNLKLEGKTLFVDNQLVDVNVRAGRNIPTVNFATSNHVSVLEMLNNNNLVITKEALEAIEEALSNE